MSPCLFVGAERRDIERYTCVGIEVVLEETRRGPEDNRVLRDVAIVAVPVLVVTEDEDGLGLGPSPSI